MEKPITSNEAYAEWIQVNEPNEAALQTQRQEKFVYSPLISIVVPTFNTQETFLRDMIGSLIHQTYANWQLCIADGGSDVKFHIENILAEYAKSDSRIIYTMIGKNLGIAENTNVALNSAQGEYIGFLDHDDILAPFALYEIVKSINEQMKPDFLYSNEDKFVEVGGLRFEPYYKPDFSIDMLRSVNYIGHFSVVKQDVVKKIGGFNGEFDGSQDYDFLLRVAETTKHIVHIRKILYHWRSHEASVALNPESKLYAYEAGRVSIQKHIERVGLPGVVVNGDHLGHYQIKYEITDPKKISIVIPSKDHVADLEKCIHSIVSKTTYKDYEIIVVENNSNKEETFAYYDTLRDQKNIRVMKWPQTGFNFSAIVNYGVQVAQGTYIVLLNNDTEVISQDWLELMLMYAQREDVGVVGAKLYYPDETIQHAGVFLHPTGAAGPMSYKIPREASGYFGHVKVAQNVSAVTGACLMVKKSLYEEVGGFDDQLLKVSYNDVDFCMKIRALSKLVVFTPYAELYHHESKSRGYDEEGENNKRWAIERDNFLQKWAKQLEKGDPYYSDELI